MREILHLRKSYPMKPSLELRGHEARDGWLPPSSSLSLPRCDLLFLLRRKQFQGDSVFENDFTPARQPTDDFKSSIDAFFGEVVRHSEPRAERFGAKVKTAFA